MIGRLKGTIENISETTAIIDVGGVGYLVSCSARTLSQYQNGDIAALNIETMVREDAISLYGFATHSEQESFKVLNTVQGVGAKVALAILSTLSPEEIMRAIALEDAGAFKKVSGVGPKLAARLVTELKDKSFISTEDFASGKVTPIMPLKAFSSSEIDAVSALSALGYPRTDAARAVSLALNKLGEKAKVQDIITQSLKELAA